MGARKYPFLVDISRYIIYTSFTILIFNTVMTKDVTNISFTWLLLIFLAQSSLFLYGFFNRFYGYIIFSGFIVSGLIYMFYLKIKSLRGEQQLYFIDVV
jgi:hypothetical protein